MNSSLLEFPLHLWMNSIVPDVFETMLSLRAVPTSGAGTKRRKATGERVSGAIGIAGETLTGAVYLHLSLAFAREITALLLGNSLNDPPKAADINDVVGEFCNIVSGKLKAYIANAGTPCAMSPPSIIRGSAFAIEPMPDAQLETFYFDCLNHLLSVEIHLQPQDL